MNMMFMRKNKVKLTPLAHAIDGAGSDSHSISFGNSLDNTPTGGDAFDHLYGGASNDSEWRLAA